MISDSPGCAISIGRVEPRLHAWRANKRTVRTGLQFLERSEDALSKAEASTGRSQEIEGLATSFQQFQDRSHLPSTLFEYEAFSLSYEYPNEALYWSTKFLAAAVDAEIRLPS